MTGNQTAASTENGVEAGPGTAEGTQTVQQQEEAAFLASLALSDAFADKISFGTSGSGTSKTVTLTQNGTMTTGTFVSQVLGPIQLAIWQVMGTLPNGKGNDTNSLTRGFVTLAQNEWTNVLSNPANALTQYYNNNVQVFYPTSGVGQSFISMVATPEPGTMVLFGTGALLVGLGCARRRAGRSR